ncbi:MAG: PilN domain-containing protein [Elusimicrobia bacterium]|nr:PilN domain-containing protein [Elusimicrobiota bacterium]MBU2614746.1 PilN domain-containing protein [Elusimicrobiota bacterium]
MIKINLIPPEVLQKEAKKRVTILISLGAGALISFSIIFFFYRLTVAKQLSGELTVLQQELKKYQTIVDEVNRLKGITAILEAKKNTIQNLMKGRLFYPKLMEEFMQILPQPVWLTAMNTTSSSDGFLITMSCVSYDNIAIADFLSNLQSSPKYSNIEIGGITTNFGLMQTFSFQITCTYKAL